eukprot:scaffold48906_cov62-Phaeocystis_antarctica.AAC.8
MRAGCTLRPPQPPLHRQPPLTTREGQLARVALAHCARPRGRPCSSAPLRRAAPAGSRASPPEQPGLCSGTLRGSASHRPGLLGDQSRHQCQAPALGACRSWAQWFDVCERTRPSANFSRL